MLQISFEHFPDIIKEAAKSTLGILALMIIIIGLLGYLFFKKSGDKIKVPIFILLFLGVVGFTMALFSTKKVEQSSQSPSSMNKTDTTSKSISKPTPQKADPVLVKNLHKVGKGTLLILFNSNYEGADILVDNKRIAPNSKTPNTVTISLTAGEHRIILLNRQDTCESIINITDNVTTKMICDK